jgi:hypothetical protein
MSEKKRQKKAGQDKNKRMQARRRANPPTPRQHGEPPHRASAESNLSDSAEPIERRRRGRVSVPQRSTRRTSASAAPRSSAPATARQKAAREGKGK